MKFSLKWLGSFIETSSFFKEPQKLADRLIQAGIEVDSFEEQKARFDKMLVAQIQSVKKHPQADRLTLCEVITDSDKVENAQGRFSIVCGAKNHKSGDKVVLAQVGAVLPNGLKIKKSRIRGELSEGMLASKTELGLADENKEDDGLWILPSSAPLGEKLATYKNWDDIIFEITVPPNRSDCLSHKGLAREISALFSIPCFQEDFFVKRAKDLSINSLFLEVEEQKACPRYCACLIEGVEIKESPPWLKEKLNSLGLKSINNVVDITNFVLWDRGQPLHAFDRDKIQNLQVAPAKEGEKFLTLDDNELQLSSEDLTIRDKKGVLALAGIMGGADSSISSQTKNIVIESACFAPEKIRRTSRRIGLETDSSYRFARGVDPLETKSAMDLACYWIQKIAGGRVSKDFYDLNYLDQTQTKIQINLSDLSGRLAYSVSRRQFEKWMENLGCKINSRSIGFEFRVAGVLLFSFSFGEILSRLISRSCASEFEICPPSYRPDLKIKEDLIEEFARLEGYDKIPENIPPVFSPTVESDRDFLNFQKWTQYLSSRAWLQNLHYSFCDPEYYKDFLKSKFYLEELLGEASPLTPSQHSSAGDSLRGGDSLRKGIQKKSINPQGKTSFTINNPISQKLSLMKPLLIPDLFKTLVQNFRKNNKQGQIFELSPIFYREGDSYAQDWHLAMAIWGETLDIWQSKSIPNFYKMKGELEALFQATGLKTPLKTEALSTNQLPFLHPKKSLILNYQKKRIGFIGVLHPTLTEKHKIPVEIALAEIDLSFFKNTTEKSSGFKTFSNLLTVEKDLCFVIPESISVQKVKAEIAKTLSSVCQEVLLFDIYKKEGQRFVSFRLRLSPDKKSWTDEELQSFMQKVIQSLDKKFSIKLKP